MLDNMIRKLHQYMSWERFSCYNSVSSGILIIFMADALQYRGKSCNMYHVRIEDLERRRSSLWDRYPFIIFCYIHILSMTRGRYVESSRDYYSSMYLQHRSRIRRQWCRIFNQLYKIKKNERCVVRRWKDDLLLVFAIGRRHRNTCHAKRAVDQLD